MNTYTFKAFNDTLAVGATDHLKAMVKANKYFTLNDGMWSEYKPNHFRWVEGNFFN